MPYRRAVDEIARRRRDCVFSLALAKVTPVTRDPSFFYDEQSQRIRDANAKKMG